MQVRKDFAKRVEALSSSTPREAIANLLSALMPRVAAKTRLPEHPLGGDYAEPRSLTGRAPSPAPQWMGYDKGQEPLGQYDPMKKLTKGRAPKTRKALPTGVLQYARPNPKKRGSASARRYDQYVLGQTALWHTRNTDITASDILWDLEHNFTRYGDI